MITKWMTLLTESEKHQIQLELRLCQILWGISYLPPLPIISQGQPQWQSMIDTDVAHELSITKDKSEYVRSVGGQTESLFISSNHPSHTSAGSLDHKIITSNTCPKYVTVQNNI